LTVTTSDEELVKQYQESREESALEALFGRYVPKVRAMIFPMVLDDAVVDDLTQETMLRAVRAIDSFAGRSQFATWLYRIAMNTTHSFLRRRTRSPVVFQAEVVDQHGHDVTPDRSAIEAEQLIQTEAAIARLSAKLRAAIVLTAIQGLSPVEAAGIEECAESTMYWRIHEARKQLKHALREYLT
jgi:RNA polymerase sigma-70 factor (ECF subfamily)